MLGACFFAATRARGQTYSLLYTFCSQTNCADGAVPNPNLAIDGAGNLYGTTQSGGVNGASVGVAFEISPSGAEKVLFDFDSLDSGLEPQGGLIRDANGNLYGTASGGGDYAKNNCGGSGCGLVFELSPSGVETILFEFVNTQKPRNWEGKYPYGPLMLDGNGNLYGETLGFGQATTGAVFKLTPGGTETVLHWFGGHKDAKFPNPGLVMDAGGNIYGTTRGGGGYKGGTVFQLNPAGVETILYSFGQKKTLQYGMVPEGGLLMDASGKLYGTNSAQGPYGAGYGTVFELTPGGTPNVLYTFQGQPDGSRPMGSLVMDAKGTLYGTTSYGGMYGAGTVFKVNSAGEQILYSFTGGADGGNPMDGLVMDEKGNLYGTTLRGGNTQCPLYSGGCGVVFKIVP
ncbi:MAG TPA: choice-of-anchor tandem repeat GloVer-containing protein [Terriglobales bacterium]|nr:choice-of-anchor tandem repeat GloVer-containing protein [Terriglobales bacterium]